MPCHCYYRLTLTRRCDLLSSSGFEDLKSCTAWDEGSWRWSRQPWPFPKAHTAAHINTRRSMTIHKLWQPRVKRRGSSYDFPFVSLKIRRWQLRRIWLTERAAQIVRLFYEGPAARVSLAVIYTARERQGESLYCWAGAWAQTSNNTLQHSSSLL